MKSSAQQCQFSRVVKTFLMHLACLIFVPFLATVLAKSFAFGKGLSDLQPIATRSVAGIAQSFANGRLDSVYLAAAYAGAVTMVSCSTGAHRFWHNLILWFVFYVPLAYFTIDHDAAWAMYIVLVAPLTGIAALCAWLLSREFWRPAL